MLVTFVFHIIVPSVFRILTVGNQQARCFDWVRWQVCKNHAACSLKTHRST